MSEQRYPCASCGAQLVFEPGTVHLKCQYCGHAQDIPASIDDIHELDFHQYVKSADPAMVPELVRVLHCNQCGAEFSLPENQASGSCPFCGSNVVVPTDPETRIEPKSLLPFLIDARKAKELFAKWVGSRFWAPNNLKQLALVENGLKGCYIPYWTYDTFTTTAYVGQRGEHYWVTESYTDSNGNRQTRQVRKTRWYPASGIVFVPFDDVLVLASEHLPPKYAQAMNTWNLSGLVQYDSKFVTGFTAMRYDISLEDGFEIAKRIMAPAIDRAIRYDIGGDEQQIISARTQYDRITFKHILLPVWSGAYRYKGKSWSYLVNGQTGEVRGDAPVSAWKVAIAVILGLVIIGLIVFLMAQGG
ncbi:hypothetical protein QPK87_06900 [Kamptonema cortianum]|nr:hypothetical protein [Geitlerinema splendidum]MDK3156301.1 hypothetical protein [Kamptonema cortianum]